MDLAEYLRVLRAHKVLIAISVAVCTLAAGVLAWTRTPLYESHTQLFVSTKTVNPDDIYTGGLFSQQRIQSYAQLVTSQSVLRRVISELDLPRDAGALASRIHVVVPENTVLIDVAVTDESPNRARSIGEAIGRSFSTFVGELETARKGDASPVKVTVTGPPQLPTSPTSPNKTVYLILGALGGLVIGVVGAVISEASARSRRLPTPVQWAPRALPKGPALVENDATVIETPLLNGVADDVSAIVRAPVLGTVSEPNGRVEMGHEPIGSPRALMYQTLQENILSRARTSGLRSFVVTSAVASEGKTAISSQISSTFADGGYRVILVDANFQNPTLTNSLGLATSVGLSEVMAEHVSIDSALQSRSHDLSRDSDLRLLTIGKPRLDPVELFRSDELEALLRALRDRADLVFIDAPPVLSGYGAQELSSTDSGSIIVTRATPLRVNELEAAAASLRSANAQIVGVVVNEADRQ